MIVSGAHVIRIPRAPVERPSSPTARSGEAVRRRVRDLLALEVRVVRALGRSAVARTARPPRPPAPPPVEETDADRRAEARARRDALEAEREEDREEGRSWLERISAETDDDLLRVIRKAKPVAPELLLPRALREQLEARRRAQRKVRRTRRRRRRR
jgi:hypothetical protein